MSLLKIIQGGGVVSTPGFQAYGIHCGIKKKKKNDLAAVVAEDNCEVGAVFTTNRVKAAPVQISMRHVKKGNIRGILLNSGNANACTGDQGLKDAMEMVKETSKALQVKTSQVLVCSTGRIGVALPMDKILAGIPKVIAQASKKGGKQAAQAIMTSDTFHKEFAITVPIGGKKVTIGGMAKGAGMIHPNMATMLACLTTDAAIEGKALQEVVGKAVNESFNRISVDGDTSTNDTVLVLANGKAGNAKLKKGHRELPLFYEALKKVMQTLARMIVEDGEGISKVVEVQIHGASSMADARCHLEAISHSPLIKSSWAGNDPNWGRLLAALGYSGAKMDPKKVEIRYDGILAVKHGMPYKTPPARLKQVAKKRSFTLTLDLHQGNAKDWMWVNDLTEKYVTLNKSE